MQDTPITIIHIIYQLSTGGLENGLINLINNLPQQHYAHHIICLTHADAFKHRIGVNNVKVHSLEKQPGSLWRYYPKLYRMIKKIKPDIVHTRNLAAIECQIPAFCARVPYRIHSEHGRDVSDLEGNHAKYIWLRRALSPLIHQFIPLSKDIEHYLIKKIKIKKENIVQIYNGVDLSRFSQKTNHQNKEIVITFVGRLQPVKNVTLLVRAFHAILQEGIDQIRLWIVGEGPLKQSLMQLTQDLKISDKVDFLGDSHEVPALLAQSDIFVQPSLFEGISNTILEAMSCGLPILASDVGGNAELVRHNDNGYLFPSNDVVQLKRLLLQYIQQDALRAQHGLRSRQRVESNFSLDNMVSQYHEIYFKIKRGSSCAA